MKILMKLLILVTALVIMVACSSAEKTEEAPVSIENEAAEPPEEEPLPETSPPLATWHLDNDDSYLSRLRDKGGHLDDFQKSFAAVEIDPETFHRVDFRDVNLDGQPLFWLTPELNAAVVDERYFTDLTVVRGRDSGTPDGLKVGQFLGGDSLAPETLVRFLIFASIIEVNLHTTAEVHLLSENQNDMGTLFHFQVEDTYFTNEENLDIFEFQVGVLTNGEIWVH